MTPNIDGGTQTVDWLDQLFGTRGMTQEQLKAALRQHTDKVVEAAELRARRAEALAVGRRAIKQDPRSFARWLDNHLIELYNQQAAQRTRYEQLREEI